MKIQKRKIYMFDVSLTDEEIDLLIDSIRKNRSFGVGFDEAKKEELESMETMLVVARASERRDRENDCED